MTELLQHLDYYLVASFKVGKRCLKYYLYQNVQGTYMLERDEASQMRLYIKNFTEPDVHDRTIPSKIQKSSRPASRCILQMQISIKSKELIFSEPNQKAPPMHLHGERQIKQNK